MKSWFREMLKRRSGERDVHPILKRLDTILAVILVVLVIYFVFVWQGV